MIELSYEINGNEAGTPINASEIKLKSTWVNNNIEDKSEAEISTNSLEFALEDVRVLRDHIEGGKNGGVGIFEGVPYKIKYKDLTDGTVGEILDGYIDLADENSIISCDQIDTVIKKRKTLDWLTARTDGISFGYLFGAGEITFADYVPVPYVLNYRPEAYGVVMISMSIFMTSQALAQAIKAVSDSIADFAAIPIIGPAVNIGAIIAAGLRVVANTAYAIALTIALIKMIEELIDQLFPPVRRSNGMRLETMFEKVFNHLGLQFKSTIFDIPKWKNAVFLPQQSEAGGIFGKVKGLGHPKQSSAIYNCGDFLRVMKEMFNAQIKIDGNIARFERWDYWKSLANWIKPNVKNSQSLRLNNYSYNTNEILSNFLISFQTDFQDENTLENFKGTNYQVITQPKTVNEQDFVNIKGFAEVRLPFARATRKNELTTVEQLLNTLAVAVDSTVNFLGGNSKLSSKISSRKAMMVLSADTTGVDKLLILNGERIPLNEDDQLNAKDLWGFHAVNSFVPVKDPITNKVIHNQNITIEGEEIPLCKKDWEALLTNNEFITEDGRQGEMVDIEWDLQNQKAIISYKLSELYTKNLKLAFNEGQ